MVLAMSPLFGHAYIEIFEAIGPAAAASSLCCRGLAAVFSCQGVPADFERLAQHAYSIAYRAEPRAGTMRPLHRNFGRDEAQTFGEEEQFRVESPPLNPLQRENRRGSTAGECFESALRVFEAQA